mmetsp:Transcript_8558/g.14491  ORF Transcript_8558/g.14491 Transcript_8558/m.14491 type:complete len:224 (-) Transcript_8558:148-819(-)
MKTTKKKTKKTSSTTKKYHTPFGYIKKRQKDRCITPGLTLAYDAASESTDLPDVIWHTKIDITHPSCNEDDLGATKCLHRMYEDRPGSLRARTLTSTGMAHVNIPAILDAELPSTSSTSSSTTRTTTGTSGSQQQQQQVSERQKKKQQRKISSDGKEKMWELLEQEYGVSRYEFHDTRNFLLEQTRDIAKENLSGQCTKDHSCKKTTQAALKMVVGDGSAASS